MALDSCKKAFRQSFDLCKRQVAEQFPSIDIGKMMVDLPHGESEDCSGFDKEDPEEGEDPASLP